MCLSQGLSQVPAAVFGADGLAQTGSETVFVPGHRRVGCWVGNSGVRHVDR